MKHPMLATNAGPITFPVIASPKIDGIRAVVKDGQLLSRKMKLIPNRYTQALFGRPEFNGLDGELVVGKANAPDCMQASQSGVSRHEGEPDVTWHVFDRWDMPETVFTRRSELVFDACVAANIRDDRVFYVEQIRIETQDDLDAYEAECLEKGFEGLMIRYPDSLYKYGRSTARQGYLLKVKRFTDSEARILAVNEEMENTNEATKDETGHTKRSSAKAGMVGKGTMGSLLVKDIHTDIEFSLGSGFVAEERQRHWAGRDDLLGRVVKYKYQPAGVKVAPRFPVFIGFREAFDLPA